MVIPYTGATPPPNIPPEVQPAKSPSPEVAAKNRVLSAAVKLLNDAGAAGLSHEFSIAIDPKTRQAVIRIVDQSTREVIEQLPSEYLLRVAQQISERLTKQDPTATDKTL